MKTIIFFIALLSFPLVKPTSEMNVAKTLGIEEELPGNKSFPAFLSNFEKIDIPENISHQKIQEYKTKFLAKTRNGANKKGQSYAYLKKYIPELIYGSVSRLGPPIVEPLNRYYIDENTIAVTYLVKARYNNSGFNVNLAMFDLYGNNKVKNRDSKFFNGESVTLASLGMYNTVLCDFNAPNVFERTTFNNEWQKDIKEFGLEGNTILCYNRKEIEQVSLSSNGDVSVVYIKPAVAVVD